jgi:multimeric flavodoxin WrbA
MKILAINCSPRKGKTTQKSLEACLEACREVSDEITTPIIELADLKIGGCVACGYCASHLACSQDDDFNSLIPLLTDPELGAVIIATPVYLGSMTSQCKAFLDRSVVLGRNGQLWKNKVGGVIAVGQVRNGGQELTIGGVQAAMLCHNMVIVSGGTKEAHFGASLFSNSQAGVDADDIGLGAARNVGTRVAELAMSLYNASKS